VLLDHGLDTHRSEQTSTDHEIPAVKIAAALDNSAILAKKTLDFP
jgi:hypothetical protein